ncbi:hypothetical protein [Bacteroides sp. 224]|uniref:hypothetical protein n=1 Tax=Bacteroides sp. 224 TaxID=2302936 RepID=UPI0013D84303|nr:hypothetical protein [Bacteroides sp. 224]
MNIIKSVIIISISTIICSCTQKNSISYTCFPELLVNDSDNFANAVITNNTLLDVYCLFNNITDSLAPKIIGDHANIRVFEGNPLKIYIDESCLLVFPDRLEIKEKPTLLIEKKVIDTHVFTTNRSMQKLPDGTSKVNYDLGKKYFQTDVGTLELKRESGGCDDTGKNPFEIQHNGNSLMFTNIGNLCFFEYDLDKNGKKELFVLNYHICASYLALYKIE